MSASVNISVGEHFVIAILQDNCEAASVISMIIETENKVQGLSHYDLLVDTRGCKIIASKHDLWSVASALHLIRHVPCRKTAIVCRIDEFDLVDFFSVTAQNLGHVVKSFSSFEHAIEWLVAA